MARAVEEMFDSIAPAYDRTNTVLSLGLHRRWKRIAVQAALALPGDRVLDVATGTGDLARALRRRVGPTGLVVGVDFSAGMLAVAKQSDAKQGDKATRSWVRGDALRLPLPDALFDAATVAFGIRNVDDPVAGLREMRRTLRPGGRLVVLEFGQPEGLTSAPYRFYSRFIMPRVGGMLTGNRAAYEYLPETARRFPCGDAFVAMMREAGDFREIRVKKLAGGVAWLYVGTL